MIGTTESECRRACWQRAGANSVVDPARNGRAMLLRVPPGPEAPVRRRTIPLRVGSILDLVFAQLPAFLASIVQRS